jgi:hypothetical protein
MAEIRLFSYLFLFSSNLIEKQNNKQKELGYLFYTSTMNNNNNDEMCFVFSLKFLSNSNLTCKFFVAS